MRSARLLLALALAPYHALAQPVEHPELPEVEPAPDAQPLELAITVDATSELDPAAVRAAIAADLGIRVSEAPGAALGALSISIVQQSVRVEYRPVTGASVERTVALPASREDRSRLIAFIATNLVRDQASEVLAGLPAAPAPTAAPTAAAARAVVIPSPVTEAASTVAKPRVTRFPISIGFVPPLAVDRVAGSNVVVGVGVHAIAGTSDGSDYASVSGIMDAKREFASGAQVAGIYATAGRLDEGLQVGGIVAHSRGRTDGGQVGGIATIARGDLHGIQVGGIGALAGGRARGIQVGGIVSAAGALDGIQVSGIGSVTAGPARGIQIGGVGNVAERLDGAQIGGVINVAGEARGLQVGAINVARRMRGVQLGVVNITSDGDATVPIGIINYSQNGPLAVDAWLDSSRVSALGFRHGTRYVHNLWMVGWSPDHEHMMVGAGIGLHRAVAAGGSALGVDLDALHWFTDVVDGDVSKNLSQLRASLSLPLGPVDVFAGAAANVYVTDEAEMDTAEDFHPVAARRYTSDGGTHVVTWPTVFAGARVRLR